MVSPCGPAAGSRASRTCPNFSRCFGRLPMCRQPRCSTCPVRGWKRASRSSSRARCRTSSVRSSRCRSNGTSGFGRKRWTRGKIMRSTSPPTVVYSPSTLEKPSASRNSSGEIDRDLEDFRKKHASDYGVKNITLWWELQKDRVLARHLPATTLQKLRRVRTMKYWLGIFTAGRGTMLAVQVISNCCCGSDRAGIDSREVGPGHHEPRPGSSRRHQGDARVLWRGIRTVLPCMFPQSAWKLLQKRRRTLPRHRRPRPPMRSDARARLSESMTCPPASGRVTLWSRASGDGGSPCPLNGPTRTGTGHGSTRSRSTTRAWARSSRSANRPAR